MGISFNLKDAKNRNKGNKISFSLGKKPGLNSAKVSNNVLNQSDSEDEEDKRTSIESFDQSTIGQKKEIVIRPSSLVNTIPTTEKIVVDEDNIEDKERDIERDLTDEQKVRLSLLKGEEEYEYSGREIKITKSQNDPNEDSVDAYKEVPVEEFGAALLRGMGWNKDKDKERKINKPNSTAINRRKQGLLLGLGAKSVDNKEVEQELLSSKAKFTIPLAKRNTKTGEIIRDE